MESITQITTWPQALVTIVGIIAIAAIIIAYFREMGR